MEELLKNLKARTEKLNEEARRKVEIKHIGLDTYLYSFQDYVDFKEYFKKAKEKGNVNEVFLDNRFGFEIKLNKIKGGRRNGDIIKKYERSKTRL